MCATRLSSPFFLVPLSGAFSLFHSGMSTILIHRYCISIASSWDAFSHTVKPRFMSSDFLAGLRWILSRFHDG